MESSQNPEITGRFNWDIQEVVLGFLQGPDAEAVYNEVCKTLSGNFGYDSKSKILWGTSLPLVARVDTILRPLGIRVATTRDFLRPEVTRKIKDKFYSDTPALILRTETDNYEPNSELIQKLLPKIEEAQGTIELPARITGIDVVPASNQYGWEIFPRDDFTVLSDERFGSKYNEKRFSEVDELEIPLFTADGNKTWYARSQGLSGLCLSVNLNLSSSYEDLANSDERGRVVLISGEASTPEILARHTEKVEREYKKQERELSDRGEKALQILRGETQ